jgi:eukaryotic-like serine/threonine-protein kinase
MTANRALLRLCEEFGAPTGFAGDYILLRQLGSGGMGSVHAAFDPKIERAVALKFLHDHGQDSKALARFALEARALSAVSSPHIAALYDIGRCDERNAPFLVMQLIRGTSLDRILQPPARIGRPEPRFDLARGMVDLAEALHEGHAAGIVHRDLKPSNIILAARRDRDVHLVAVDFGLAKHTGRNYGLTEAGFTVGTPQYMSPEQTRGSSMVDHRSDIYTLGASSS